MCDCPGKGAAALLCAALLRSKRNRGRLALLAALHLVAELLALVQIANSRLFDGGNVHEHVLRAIVGLDEPVTSLGAEPLYGSSSHCKPFEENYYAAPAIERRSKFGTERKANSVLDTSEEMARRTTESDSTYVGWLRGRYKKRREGSYGHQRGRGSVGNACDAVG
jgi:hypothetical protein